MAIAPFFALWKSDTTDEVRGGTGRTDDDYPDGIRSRKPTRKGRLLAGTQGSSKGLVIALVRLRASKYSSGSHRSRTDPTPRAYVDTVQTGGRPGTLPRSVLSAQKSNRISETGKITGAGVANLSGGCTEEVGRLFFRQVLSQKSSIWQAGPALIPQASL